MATISQTTSSSLTEHEIRTLMARRRRKWGRTSEPVCDLCEQDPATDRHHIINRGLTMSNPVARELSNAPCITTCLCRACHAVADSPDNRDRLLHALYRIEGRGDAQAGYALVAEHVSAVQAALNTRLPWELPLPRAEGD